MKTIYLYLFIICILIFEVKTSVHIPNVQMIEKFMTLNNSVLNNESYNPYVDLSTPEIIRMEGYPSEGHTISTEDGYLLTLHRIPGKLKSHPILLQHGLLSSSADWVLTGPRKSLAFILADYGYDVWLGNFRGNTYSRAHKSLSPNDAKFWDFSWHEMGIYDLPAMISYITNLKQSNLTYIGHSMGTTSFYVMSRLRSDIASKVQMMFSLAPVAYMKHIKSPLRLLAPFARDLKSVIHFLGEDEFLPHDKLTKYFAKYGCDIDNLEHKMCSNILFAIFGFDKSQFNYSLIPVIFGHVPAGASVKTIVHFAQEIQSGKFQQFDYGPEQNLKIYNSTEPPNYDTSKISVPIILFYANNDWCASVKDVLRLYSELNNVIDIYKIPYTQFNHMDFLWAIEAPNFVYSKILRAMKDIIKMRLIFVYFCTIYILVNFVECLEDISINNEVLDMFELSNYIDFNGKHNPDVDLNTEQLITKYGYPSETHIVVTEDYYLLTLHRIRGKPNSHPVLVQHGLLASSADWVIPGPKKGLAYLLADDGYDVWLGNFRGNTYSRAHQNLSPNDAKFWDFSWHEMGIYDLPAMITYITNLKQSNLTYIGHSMGSTAFYVMSTMRSDLTSRIKMMFSLGPAIYLSQMKSPARYFAPFSNNLQFLTRLFGQNEFLPQSSVIKFLVKYGCDLSSLGTAVCSNIVFLLAGFDKAQMNTTLLPVILSHAPAGASTKTLIHFLQEVKSAKFRQFDYGTKKNRQMYNSIIPPEYNISTITVPIALYYGSNDWFINVKDLFKVSKELKNVIDVYKVPFEKFNHVDFMWAVDAPKLVYSRILRTMKGD
ncbi:PREDICTED: uncharacterized protein LOC107070697 [Polistes dominula]|uniref:Uncharacterized protein LOC107070697 n=1 Tax=Polistes dominula TaxID=743375 RepID=A0ABM1IWN2_POLDO|nr:PREDICTED: uncharacterized protein LOC107070697 [Polistes dominula]